MTRGRTEAKNIYFRTFLRFSRWIGSWLKKFPFARGRAFNEMPSKTEYLDMCYMLRHFKTKTEMGPQRESVTMLYGAVDFFNRGI